jgi:hypothetical protein
MEDTVNANDSPTPDNEWVLPPEEPTGAEDAPRRTPRRRTLAKLSALVAASVVVGAGASHVVNHSGDSAASAGTANAPAAVSRGNDGPPGRIGGIAGEQHVQGAVTAKTSSTVTVGSSSGTATYSVDSTSEIVRDGQPATLSEVKVGDAVLVHVYPSSGRMLVERLFAGTLSGGGVGPPAPDDDSDGSSA